MKSQYRHPDSALKVNGEKLVTHADKAEALADAFAKASTQAELPDQAREYRRQYESEHPLTDPTFEPFFGDSHNADLTMKELKAALAGIVKASVSEGPDQISYRMLRELPDPYLEVLLRIYRECWNTGQVPAEWKEATVCPIPKKKKPKTDVGSYRPIALTSHVGKVMERMIKQRLQYFMERNRVVPECQAGFRKRRGVADHLVKLSAHIRKALARRRTLYACFFDIKQAYDSVWHRKLLEKLQRVGMSGRMYYYIQSFLGGRSFRVRCGTTLSSKRFPDMGVPQGAVIAPLLFNIMIHDVNVAVEGPHTLTAYADDVALWHEPRNVRRPSLDNFRARAALQQFQSSVDQVCHYMQSNGFQLAATKTVFTVFAQNRVVGEQRLSISINGQKLFPSPSVKYLGVTFSSQGTYHEHVKAAVLKARSALNLMKQVSREPWASSPKLMVTLATALVRSRLLYGVEAFFGITQSQWQSLEQVYRQSVTSTSVRPTARFP